MLNKELHLAISRAWAHIQNALIDFLKGKDPEAVRELLTIARDSIEEALQMLDNPVPCERPPDGIYLLRDGYNYEKTVEATFSDGKLVRLVDKYGNDFMGWHQHVCWDEPREAHK